MRPPITSPQNPRIKHLVKLRQRRQRDRHGQMLIDGARALQLALDCGTAIETIFFNMDGLSPGDDSLLYQANAHNIDCQPVSAAAFARIRYGDGPDALVGLASQNPHQMAALPPAANPLYLVTEGLEKPGNLGAILRSADAAGVSGVIVCNSQTDLHNPNLIRASRGAFFSVPVAQSETDIAIQWLHENSIQILAATPGLHSRPYTEVNMCGPTALVLGAEHEGLSVPWLRETAIHIPMYGRVDSLNVAQAASILLFESLRQRGQ